MAGKRKRIWADSAGKRGYALLATVLLLAVLILCVQYLRLTDTPMESRDLIPSGDPARWRFTLEDGTELEPENGELPLAGTDNVVVCRTTLPEDVIKEPCFVVTANYADCAIFLNGKLVYAPSGRFSDGRFSDTEYPSAAASGQFVARITGENDELTMLVQFRGEDRLMKHLPRLTQYSTVIAYNSQAMAATAEAAFPAGMYFALTLFLMGLFLFGAWRGRWDVSLLLLALGALSMALSGTLPYAIGIAWTYSWATVSVFCAILPLLAVSWTLWYRLSRRLRLISLPLLGLVSAAMLVYLVAGFGQFTALNKQLNIMQIWVVPGVFLLMLIVSAIDAVKGSPWFRRFFRYLACSLPAAALAWGISSLTGGKLSAELAAAIRHLIEFRSLFKFAQQLCVLLLILCFVQTIVDLITGLARQNAELQALSLREKYASENMKLMLETQESTRREHHEMRHHVAVLDEMLSAGEQERAQNYARSLMDKVSALPSDAYSSDPIINVIVGRYLNEAKAKGITVAADIMTGDRTPLQDDELCVLLTNMLENALEACCAMSENADRFIRFRLRSSEEHMTVSCSNSTDAVVTIGADGNVSTSKPDAEHHGFGLPVMRQITEKHNGQLTVSCSDGCFTLKSTM